MRVLAVIPARGGSKGVPRKNVRDVAGAPLIAWTLRAAAGATRITRAIVSTDDDEIAAVARAAGGDVPFARPAALAADDTPGTDVIAHALDAVEALEGAAYDAVVCLQPTSPLRTAADIDAALALLAADGDAVVSVAPARQHPLWIKRVDDAGVLRPWSDAQLPARRQDLPPAYVLNGAIYAARSAAFRAHKGFYGGVTRAYVMPEERSIDVDTELDLTVAAHLLAAGGRR